jgi:hypothetical protein
MELFPSEQWDDGKPGLYRLRIDRKWHDGSYIDVQQISAIASTIAVGESPVIAPEPDLPVGTSVSVANGRKLGDVAQRDVTRTTTPPILAYDGRWYVGVLLWGRGTALIPVDELKRR